MAITIAITDDTENSGAMLPKDWPARLRRALRGVLRGEGRRDAAISVALVDDPTMRELNRQYLRHDYATDVLSFLLDADTQRIEGEIIISLDTAGHNAIEYGCQTCDELLLYAVHGTLHLLGYDDQAAADQRRMRAAERQYLELAGAAPQPVRRSQRGRST